MPSQNNTVATNTLAGIDFPFRVQGNGLPAAATGIEEIRSALIVLLRTKQRSRVMRPLVGMNLHTLIFEDSGPVLQSLIVREILTQIAAQLPQVVVQDIQATGLGTPQNPNGDKTIQVNVFYYVQGILNQTGFVTVPASTTF